MCSNCIIALHQRNRFEVPGKADRVPSNLPLWELNFAIGPDKLGPLIVAHSLIESLIGPPVDLPWKTDILLEEPVLRVWNAPRLAQVLDGDYPMPWQGSIAGAIHDIAKISQVVYRLQELIPKGVWKIRVLSILEFLFEVVISHVCFQNRRYLTWRLQLARASV